MTKGQKIAEFVEEAHAKGMTVYFQTYLRTTKLAPKHAALARINAKGQFQILHGKQGWLIMDCCSRISAH